MISFLRHLLTIIVLSGLMSTSSFAQYSWIDENGRKQFSDQAPPANVPKHKILKFEDKTISNPDAASGVAFSNSKIKQEENLAEKELAFKKRQGELAEKEKKQVAETQMSAAKKENCQRMRAYRQTLESGQNIAQLNDKGERGFMSNEKRAQELTELQQGMSECEADNR